MCRAILYLVIAVFLCAARGAASTKQHTGEETNPTRPAAELEVPEGPLADLRKILALNSETVRQCTSSTETGGDENQQSVVALNDLVKALAPVILETDRAGLPKTREDYERRLWEDLATRMKDNLSSKNKQEHAVL